MSGELDETRAAIERTREAWRLHADLSKERAAIVRKVAGWVRGDEPPPDGATRADALERGPAWSGWDWSRRGVDVSPAFWNAEREAAADARLSFLRVALDCERQAANHAEIDARAGWGDSGCAGPWRDLAARYRAVLALVEEIAGGEEGAAWREWEAACKEARRTLPLAEIEAARARLEAEAAAKVQPVRVEVAGLAAVVENTGAAALAAKQGAREAKRTREAVEQQGAAVVGAVREVGAKVGENGKAKPPARSKDGTAKRKKREAWPDKARDMARAFQRALPSLLPDDSPLNDKGELDARRVVGGWSAIVKCFERWATRNPGLVPVAFPRGAAAVEDALKSLFRALKDSGE